MKSSKFSVRAVIACGLKTAWQNVLAILLAEITFMALALVGIIVAFVPLAPFFSPLISLIYQLKQCTTPECTAFIRTQMGQALGVTGGVLVAVIVFAVWIFIAGLGFGFYKFLLNVYDKNNPQLKDLFSCFDMRLVYVLVASTLLTCIVGIGFALLVIPGLIAFARLTMSVPVIIIDQHVGPIHALQMSWELTRGNTWRLVGLWLAVLGTMGLLNLIPFMSVVTGPLFALMMVCAYRHLQASK